MPQLVLDKLFHRRVRQNAFSLPELLVVIVIIGVTAAIGVQAFFFLVRRARVQSVALEVAGWIENVRNVAADEVNQAESQGGCVITFTPSAGMGAQAPLASVDDNCNMPEDVLRIPNTIQQDQVTVDSPLIVIFTPRGLWTDANGSPGDEFLMTITLEAGGPLRCVRLSPTLGSVEIGRPDSSSGDSCQNWELL